MILDLFSSPIWSQKFDLNVDSEDDTDYYNKVVKMLDQDIVRLDIN